MKTRINYGILAAWLIHAAAWFVPVAKYGVRFPKGLPGWEAFRVACYAIWPEEGFHYAAFREAWQDHGAALLATASALTTVLFILGSPWIVWRGSRLFRRASAWIALAAFIINTHWYALGRWNAPPDRSDLRIGYFLWWLSFGVFAFGLFILAQKSKPTTERSQVKSAGCGLP